MTIGTRKTSKNTPPTKEQARALLWKRGELNFLLWNKIQRKIEAKFIDCLKRKTGIFFVNCTRGGGKTYWAVKKTYEYIRHPDIVRPQVWLATAYAEDLRTIIIPTFEALSGDRPDWIPIDHIPSQKMYVDRVNKGLVHYRGLDLKKNALRGNYADLVIIEECQNVRNLAYLWNYVVKQLFRHRPFPMAVFVGTPPESPDHDWVEIMEIAKMNDAYVEATIDEHDMMSDAEKAFMMKDITDDAKLREYYCKIVIDKTKAIVPEWKEEYEREWPRDDFFKYYHTYEAMDLGIIDQTVCLYGFYDFQKATLVVEDEVMMHGPEMTTDKLAAALRSKEIELWSNKKVYYRASDTDNLLLIQDLASLHGINFACTTKDTLEAMVNQLRLWVRAGRVVVHPRCKYAIGCLRTALWDDRRKGFARSRLYGHYDALAALVYMVRNVRSEINPVPATYAMDLSTHYISKKLVTNQGPNVEAMKKMVTGIKRRHFSRR